MQRMLMGDTTDRQWKWMPWIYPVMIFAAAFAVAILLGITIVPTFKQMFLEFGLMLPAATKWLIWGSDSMILHPIESIVTVMVALALIGLIWFGARWIADRLPCESRIARVLAGSRGQVRGMARWTGGLAEMLQLGIPLPQAVTLAGMLSGQRSLESQSMRLAHGESMRATGISPVAIAALQCDDSHQRVALLRSLSDLYWNRVAKRTHMSAGWIAPIAVVFAGAFVAFVVIALFMPLISLVSSLSS
jgi:type IV pilus assembly protein PilC